MGLDSETAVNFSKKNITTCCAELAKTALKTNKLAKSFSFFPPATAENQAFEPAERCPSSHFEFWATGAFSACCSLRSVFQEHPQIGASEGTLFLPWFLTTMWGPPVMLVG